MNKKSFIPLLSLILSVQLQVNTTPIFNDFNANYNNTTFNNSSLKISSTEKFQNEKLALVYDIFHNTTRKNIEAYMKKKGYGAPEIDPPVDYYGETLSFSSSTGVVDVEYQTNGGVQYVLYSYSGAIINTFVENELENHQYKFILKKFKAGVNFDQDFEKKIWSKSGTEYRFATSVIPADKAGAVAYGNLED